MTRRNGNRLRAAGVAACFLALGSLASGKALAQAQPEGQQADLYSVNATGAPEKIRTGLFAETSVGGFITLGGQTQYSNFSAFLEIGLGYDITKEFALTLRFLLGPSSANCYAAAANSCPPTGTTNTDTFTVTTGDLVVSYRFAVADRLYVPVRLMGGISLLNPTPDTSLQATGALIEPNFGGASGIEWATPMDHFTIDAEICGQYILGINALALSIYPTVRYTF